VKFANGASYYEASRFATGRKTLTAFEEINGSRGSIVFNLERMDELQLYMRKPQHRVQDNSQQDRQSYMAACSNIIGLRHI